MTKKNPRHSQSLRGAESLLGPLSRPLRIGKSIAQALKSNTPRKKKGKRRMPVTSSLATGQAIAAYSSLRNSTPSRISSGRCQEFVTDLVASSTAGVFYMNAQLPLNPGNVSLFPRLNAMADLYQQWRFKHFRAIYRPTTAVVNSGVVGMCVDYDASAVAVSSVASLMSNVTSVIAPIYQPMTLDLDCSRETWYFTHNSSSSTGALSRQEQPACLFFVSDKCASNQSLGFLSIDYEIEFFEPKPPSSVAVTGTLSVTPVTAVTTASVFFNPLTVSINRGFNEVRHTNGDDESIFGLLGLNDYIVNQGGTFAGRISANLTLNAGVTANIGFAFLPPGSNTWDFSYATGFTGVGFAQTLNVYSAPVLPAGARVRPFVGQFSANANITMNSGYFTLVALVSAEYGVREMKVAQDDSSVFELPLQLSSALDFLNTHSGSCFMCCSPALRGRFNSPTYVDEDDGYSHVRGRGLLSLPGTPRSVKSFHR